VRPPDSEAQDNQNLGSASANDPAAQKLFSSVRRLTTLLSPINARMV